MSPDAVGFRVSRVLRGGSATTATALAFPTIIEAPRVNGGAPDSSDAVAAEPAEIVAPPEPVIDERELEKIRLEAAARGYEDGYAAGRDEALIQVNEQASALLAQLAAAVRSFETRRQRSFDELTTDVAQFAFATVEAMLGRELQLAASPTRDAIERALRMSPDRVHAIVRINPADVELVGSVEDIAAGRSVEVVADPSVEPGGCIVRADDCEVDAQFSEALQRLRAVLHLPEEPGA